MKKILPLLLFSAILLQACSQSTPPTAVVNTVEPIVAPRETATPESMPTVQPTDTQPVVAPVTHVTIPSAGTSDRATAHDNENSLFYDTKKVKAGDEFYKNRFERPFTSVNMDYLPDLDIVNFSITSDENFFYVKISMVEPDPATQSLTGSYGV